MFRIVVHALVFLLLSLITQVGGLVYLIAILAARSWKRSFPFKTLFIFAIIYLITTFLLIPPIASLFNREPIQHQANIKPANYLTILLNRHYVDPKLNKVLSDTAKSLQKRNISIIYLDANFPFLDHFPMLPHLSHDDGEKVDISFVYEDEQGKVTDKTVSVSGYGVFEAPKQNEKDWTHYCQQQGYFHYGLTEYLSFGRTNKDLSFSENGTRQLVNSLLQQAQLGKLFIEPNLKQRLRLTHPRIRFQGCWAVRHDDHIHIQLR